VVVAITEVGHGCVQYVTPTLCRLLTKGTYGEVVHLRLLEHGCVAYSSAAMYSSCNAAHCETEGSVFASCHALHSTGWAGYIYPAIVAVGT
jgi:hypothetical protein